MEKLLSSLSKLPMKALEWWNKFSTKQKTVIVCVAAGVVLLFSVLTVFLTRDQYKVLITAETTKEAAKVKELLDENSLTYKVSADGKQVSILTTQESDANLVLGAKTFQHRDIVSIMLWRAVLQQRSLINKRNISFTWKIL